MIKKNVPAILIASLAVSVSCAHDPGLKESSVLKAFGRDRSPVEGKTFVAHFTDMDDVGKKIPCTWKLKFGNSADVQLEGNVAPDRPVPSGLVEGSGVYFVHGTQRGGRQVIILWEKSKGIFLADQVQHFIVHRTSLQPADDRPSKMEFALEKAE